MVSQFERDVFVICESSDIEVERAVSDFNKMSAFYAYEAENSTGEASSQATQKSKSKFRQVIEKIWQAIVNAFKNFGNAIASLFQGSVSPEEYFKNPNVQIKLEEDVQAINEQINDEVRKGRKLIGFISRKTGVSDKVVEQYVDGAAEKANGNFRKIGATVLTGAAGLATFLGIKAFGKKCKEECEAAKRDCDNAKTDNPEDQKKMMQIFSAMNKLKSVAIKKSAGFFAACKAQMGSIKDTTKNAVSHPKETVDNLGKKVDGVMKSVDKTVNKVGKDVKKTSKKVGKIKKNWDKAVERVLG